MNIILSPNQSATDDLLKQILIQNQNQQVYNQNQDTKIQIIFDQIGTLAKALHERPQGALPSNTEPNRRGALKAITTRSGVFYDGPPIQPLVVQSSHIPSEPASAPAPTEPSYAHNNNSFKELPKRNPHQPSIPYPQRLKINKQKRKMIKDLLSNKEKLLEVANTPLNENCSAVILKKLPEKLGNLGRFLIPCDFTKMAQCMALDNLVGSINLMPLIIYQKLKLPELIVEEFRARNDARMVSEIIRYPSDYDHDMKIRIDYAYNLKFSCMIDFAALEDMDAYRDEGMGDVIFGELFLREVGICNTPIFTYSSGS
ncbi:hypothetical protein Tco_1411349 [Tanacetum coccineum]